MKKLLPGEKLGIIGGDEKGKFLTIAAKNMGFQVQILDPDANCPASGVADEILVADFSEEKAIEELAVNCQRVIYATEEVSPQLLRHIQPVVYLPQNPDLLEILQDRMLEKAFLEDNEAVVAPYATIVQVTDIQDAIDGIGYPCVLKMVEKKSNGQGQLLLYSPADLRNAMDFLRFGPCVLEAWIPKEREITVQVFANDEKKYAVLPAVEKILRDNTLHEAIMPARILPEVEKEAQRIALKLAKSFAFSGTLAVEFFVAKGGTLYVNELATVLDASSFLTEDTCSFGGATQFIRATCNWALGDSKLLANGVLVNILAQEQLESEELLADFSKGNFYYYGRFGYFEKEKVGHLTILTEDIYETLEQIYQTKIWD